MESDNDVYDTDDVCSCGSGLPRYRLYDARGIFCDYVCMRCEEKHRVKYRADVMSNSAYECDERIDDDY